jgi:hypothetical protein
MKKKPKKLALSTETLRSLGQSDLGQAAGGTTENNSDCTIRCTGCTNVCSGCTNQCTDCTHACTACGLTC